MLLDTLGDWLLRTCSFQTFLSKYLSKQEVAVFIIIGDVHQIILENTLADTKTMICSRATQCMLITDSLALNINLCKYL